MARFLLVDDSRTSRAFLAAALRAARSDAQTEEASSLDEALMAFARGNPDAVFLDMQLDLQATGEPGGSSGLVALDLMLRERPSVPVVLVTGLPRDHPDVEDALGMGARAVLEKPVGRVPLEGVLRGLQLP